ncbi:MAG: orotate phosphoribosyltransferase [Actinomycetota bacterium]|nr:orotate phosphoribosyltransferase [Actinomycetota bacterium]
MSEWHATVLEEVYQMDDEALLSKLKNHIIEHSTLTGRFILKSGLESRWFIDSKKTVCSAEGMLLVANAMYRVIPAEATAVGGLTMGADPIAFSTAAICAALGRPLRSFSVRKEAKDHGGRGRIAGMLLEGDRVVITEDTVTRGTSMLEAVTEVRDAGAEVIQAVALVDRGGSARRILRDVGVEFKAIFSANDLGFDYEGGFTF